MSGRSKQPWSIRRARIATLSCLFLALACGPSGEDDGGGATGFVPPEMTPENAQHVLDRTGYGGDPWTRERIETLGLSAYLEEQLDPASIDDAVLQAELAGFTTLSLPFFELQTTYGDGMAQVPFVELLAAKVLRSAHSRRQLEQVLVDFWFDHFNVFPEGPTAYGLGAYERDAIRPHVLGRFEDMLQAVARNPAMQFYLDNYLSSVEGTVIFGVERGLNENYARELMELHTLGVDGGYEEEDVIEVAKALTGWTIAFRGLDIFTSETDGFLFLPGAHDDAQRFVLDISVPAGLGVEAGREVLSFLAAHPSTARFVCGKLIVRFVDELPPADLLDRCAATYLETDGDLKATTRAVLLSEAFFDPARFGGKVKRPLHQMASTFRATGALLADEQIIQGVAGLSALQGEGIYQARPPTGHPDDSAHWASGGALVSRLNVAELITANDLALGIDWGAASGAHDEIVDALERKLFPGGLDALHRAAALEYLDALGGPVPGVDPLFDAFKVRETAALLLSSPAFMRH